MSRESRVLILRLALRAIRWRAAASATVFVVAVVAIFAATVGPIYLPAVDQAVLAKHLKAASLFQRDVLISRHTVLGYPGVNWDAQVRGLAAEFSRDPLFARPLSEEQVDVDYGGPEPLRSEIASVEDLCVHVRIIHGRCVSGDSTGETVISSNTAAAEHLRSVARWRPLRPPGFRSGCVSSVCTARSRRRVVLGAVGPLPVRPARVAHPGRAGRRVVRDLGRTVLPGAASVGDAVGERGTAPRKGWLRRHRRTARNDRARECHCRGTSPCGRGKARPSPP